MYGNKFQCAKHGVFTVIFCSANLYRFNSQPPGYQQ